MFLLSPLLPLITALAFNITLLILGILWLSDGSPNLNNSYVPSISAIGGIYKVVMLTGFIITAVFLILTLAALFIFSFINGVFSSFWFFVAIFFGTAAATSLILLSIFDTYNYKDLHFVFTIIFFTTIYITTIAIYLGLLQLWGLLAVNELPPVIGTIKILTMLYKLIFIIIAFFLVIAFIILISFCPDLYGNDSSCYSTNTAANVLEWVIAVMLGIYLANLVFDFIGIEILKAA